ncbi:hypothetical protein GT037_005675 [Alternaria burnsii]|uniref:Beta-lactamase-related domain-containing protein n=1 Tax=Alternaria burnsii TaxID=1187904 RepID=A0A8H7BBC6_9PLEO|nr:uncharacterized protein GT037_005675 [Alternaria burnsii]KAF7676170.1 hypothetical protein GT037_005675 [Alternaria burnsii]
MSNLKSRLQDLGPSITRILEIAGAAGASIGVIHNNETLHFANFGYRDVTSKVSPDEHTIYHVASLSKSFTAAAVGILVDEKKLAFEQPVSSVLGSLKHPDPSIQDHATILDFLSHRTGLATKQSLWAQDGQELLLKKNDSLSIVSYLEVVQPLGTWYNYNNWGYDVAAAIVEQASGQSWGSFVSERVLDPLQLRRTFVEANPPEDNYAMGYMPGPDGSLTPVGRPTIANGTVQQGANGIKTTASDLLQYYKTILHTWKTEVSTGSSDISSPLKNVRELLTEHISMDPKSEFKQSYGAGWAIVDLPSPVGAIGTNGMFVANMPVLGKGTEKKKLWYHNGSLVGFFSSVHVIPDTDTIVVVLVNSIPKNDAPDWIGQLLIEEILGNPDKNDYIAYAEESANSYVRMWQELEEEFNKTREQSKHKRHLDEYVGRYYNVPRNWYIEVTLEDGNLFFSFQGLASQKHQLHHHGADCFNWPLTEKRSRTLGRWPDLDASTYEFRFDTNDDDNIIALRWVHDPDIPDGEQFPKVTDAKVPNEATYAQVPVS